MTSEPSTEKELRLALGMRGGVSLAVWIGGACSEIDRLRKAADSGSGEAVSATSKRFWPALLARSLYGSVVVDVIAGASAGGLNGVLFAASQQYGFDLDRLRDVWINLGKLARLVRAPGDPSPSLLDGDGSFLEPLHNQLVDFMNHRTGPTSRPTIDLQLSATLVEPLTLSGPRLRDQALTKERFAARFHFSHNPKVPWAPSSFPDPTTGEVPNTLWRLAIAARATSSYPGAFEAAAVRATRPPNYSTSAYGPGHSGLVDMRGTFSESAAPGDLGPRTVEAEDFVVADGGILDNIPLGKALRAIAEAPADTPTHRVLVYLQPGEAIAPAIPPPPDSRHLTDYRRSSFSVLRGALHARVTAENITEDMEELERHNRDVQAGRLLRRQTFAGMGPDGLLGLARDAWPSYLSQRAAADAARMRLFLDDPTARMGEDPFPAATGEDASCRSPLGPWTFDQQSQLDGALLEMFSRRFCPLKGSARTDWTWVEAREGKPVFAAGVGPLMRVSFLLIDWARYLEDKEVEGAGEAKAVFYRVLLFAEGILDRYRRMAWVDQAVTCSPTNSQTVADWADKAAKRADRLLFVPVDLAVRLAEQVAGGETVDAIDDYRHLASTWLDAPPSRRAPVDLRAKLFDVVRHRVSELRGKYPGSKEPGADIHRALAGVCPGEREIPLVALAALEIVCMPEYLVGMPGAVPVEFVQLSADNRTPIARLFTTLRKTAAGLSPPVTDIETIPVDLKLAGNELMNFSAFLKDSWRANDWMWGRLDAVPTLVDLLVTTDGLQSSKGEGEGGIVGYLKLLVCDTPGTAQQPTGPSLPTPGSGVWACYKTGICDLAAKLEKEEPIDDTDIRPLRDALIACRQWEILAEELAKPPLAKVDHALLDGDQAPLDGDSVLERVGEYKVGAETLTEPRDRDNVEMFEQLGFSTARSLRWHAAILREGKTTAASAMARAVEAVAKVVIVGAHVLPGVFLGPRAFTASPAKVVYTKGFRTALLLAVVAAPFVWAFARDPRAAGVSMAATTAVFLAMLMAVLWLGATPIRRVIGSVLLVAGLVMTGTGIARALGWSSHLGGGPTWVRFLLGIALVMFGIAVFYGKRQKGRRRKRRPVGASAALASTEPHGE